MMTTSPAMAVMPFRPAAPTVATAFSLLLVLLFAHAVVPAAALEQNYTRQALYQGSSFFDGFDFFTGGDPTHGFVSYVDRDTALRDGLVSADDGSVYVGADHVTTLPADGSQGGRRSVRLTSRTAWTQGLFIADFQHMPGGICGTWPAYWTLGPDWPDTGEIDIIEGVNSAAANLMSLHTGANCTTAGAGETGTLLAADCYQYSATEPGSGCGVQDGRAASYGGGFNAGGGGVHAMQWTRDFIRVWFWPRGSVPADVPAGTPDPSGWGPPVANFQGGCDFASHFRQHSIVLDLTFCGDWGGNVWSSDANCKTLAPSCAAHVAGTPGAFTDAYWRIYSIAVYQASAAAAAPPAEDIAAAASSSSTSSSATLSSATPAPQHAQSLLPLGGNGATHTVPVPVAAVTRGLAGLA